MVDWKAVAMSLVRAEGQFYTDVAELALDRKLDRQNWPRLLGDRLEAVQQTMLSEWRAAGVTYPMTLYGTVGETSAMLWTLALVAAPGRTLRFTGTLFLIGGLYGVSQAFSRRRAAAPAGEPQPQTPPLRPFEEQQGGPYRSAGW